jgi:hypothetical protein
MKNKKLKMFLLTIFFVSLNSVFGQMQVMYNGQNKDTVFVWQNLNDSISLTLSSVPVGTNFFVWANVWNTAKIAPQTINAAKKSSLIFAYAYQNPATLRGVDSVRVIAYPPLSLSTLSNISGCNGDSVTLQASPNPLPNHTYQWYVGGVFQGVNNYQFKLGLTPAVQGQGVYCKVTNSVGLSDSTNVVTVVTVHTLPTATFNAGVPVCPGSSVTNIVTPTGVSPLQVLLTSNTADYSGPNPITGISSNTPTNIVCTPASLPITYHFRITDGNGCVQNY